MSDYECGCPGCGKIGYVNLAELYSGDPLDQMCSACLKSERERREVMKKKCLTCGREALVEGSFCLECMKRGEKKAYDQWDYPADGEPNFDDPRA